MSNKFSIGASGPFIEITATQGLWGGFAIGNTPRSVHLNAWHCVAFTYTESTGGFDGVLDETRTYDRALGASEVSDIANGPYS